MGLTLREGNREYFYQQLDKCFPKLKEKYISIYKNSYYLNSPYNDELMKYFHQKCEEDGIVHRNNDIFAYIHKFESNKVQISFLDKI